MQQLSVWLDNQKVGHLKQDDSGRMSFSYLPGAERILSVSMPLRSESEPYGPEVCEAFFGGLLPENEQARQLIGKRFGVNGNNSFSLLKAIGHECAGAVSVHEDSEKPLGANLGVAREEQIDARVLSEKELADHIRELPKRPLFLGLEGLRLSLAGAADKAAVCLIDGQVALPVHGSPTTHILKPDIETVGATAANEFFCLRVAARLGLPAAKVELRQAEDVRYLLVERYDRVLLPEEDHLTRLHQEDFCQALGVVSARKYQSDGGPGFKACFDALSHATRPAIERNRFASMIIFNYLIGNMDAHAKNFSLLHGLDGLTLAPVYDVLCTRIYKDLSNKMAMKVDKYYEADDIFPRHWQRLCTEVNYAYPVFRRAMLDSSFQLQMGVEAEREEQAKLGLKEETFDAIVDFVYANCARTEERFAQETAGKPVS